MKALQTMFSLLAGADRTHTADLKPNFDRLTEGVGLEFCDGDETL